MFNRQTGNLAAVALSAIDWGPYRPRFSTGEFRPVVVAMDSRFATSLTPDSIEIDGTFYDPTGIDGDELFRVGKLFDTTGLSPGRYSVPLDITEHYASDPDFSYPFDAHALVSGPSNVLMSPGWSIPGIDRLTVTPDGALWQSNGDQLIWFTEDDGDYLTPNGDQDGSTLIDNLDGTFTLTNRWGDAQTFNALGLVTEKVDRLGRTTTFTYTDEDGDSDYDDISEVEDYDGRTLTFGYTSNRISSITGFDGREVLIDYDVNDQVQSFTSPDPDGIGPLDELVTSYTYVSGTSYLETIDDGGNVTEFTYNSSGALIARENPDGTTEEFQDILSVVAIDPGSGLGTSLNPAPLTPVEGIVAVHQDENGEDVTYELGKFGLPTKMIDPLGNETTYLRDLNGRITQQTDPDPDGPGGEPAPITYFEYDSYGNLIEMTLPDSSVLTWEYDTTWNVPTKYVDGRGSITLYDIDPGTGLVDSVQQVIGEIDDLVNLEVDDVITGFTYTAAPGSPTDPPAGLVETMTDPLGQVTVYTYNARGDVTSVTYADGTADEATAYIYYNADGTVDYELDELSRRTDYDYDLLGRPTLVTLPDPDGGGPLARPEIEYEYDIWNRVVKQIDPLDRETIYTYDERGRQTKLELPDHDSDKNLTTSSTKYNDRGWIESISDPLNRETTFTYDKLGRQTKVALPEIPDPSTAENEVQTIDFDGGTAGTFKLNGNSKSAVIDLADLSNLQSLLDTIWGLGNTLVTNNGTSATVAFRRLWAGANVAQMTVSDVTGTGGATPFVATDSAGQAADLVNPELEMEYDGLGRVISQTDVLGQVTHISYVNFGRQINVQYPDPDGPGATYSDVYATSYYDENGNLVTDIDRSGHTTYYEYDELNRLTKVTQLDPYNGSPVTTYEYDAASNLRFVTDPLGNVTEYQYDNRNRQVKIIQPDPDGIGPESAPVTEFEYDDAGQLQKVTDPLDRVTEYDYDGLGQLIKVTLPDPDGAGITYTSPEIKYEYDAAGRKTKETHPDPDGAGGVAAPYTVYDYDLLDNLVQVTEPDPDYGGGLTSPVSKWKYDDAGQLLQSTDPLGNVTTYTYDDQRRLLSVTQPDPDAGGPLAAPVTSYRYDLNGNQLAVIDPLQHVTEYAYDYFSRVSYSTDARLGKTSFTYDNNGNRLTLTDPVANTTTWTYDSLGRVEQETNPLYGNRLFEYDLAGNLRMRTDRLNRVYVLSYDNLQRLTREDWWQIANFPSISISQSTAGSAEDEVQQVGFYDGTPFISGTFTLTFDGQTTSAIAWDADAATVEAALVALSNIGPGDVSVDEAVVSSAQQEWTISFAGALAGTDVAQITVDASSVYNGVSAPTETAWTPTAGYSTNEVQSVSLASATTGYYRLIFDGQITTDLSWDATDSEIESALEALSNIDNVTVSGSAGGPYTIEFGGALAGVNVGLLTWRPTDVEPLANSDFVGSLIYEYDASGQMTDAFYQDGSLQDIAGNFFTYDDLGRVTNETMAIGGYADTITLDQEYDLAGNRMQALWSFGTTEEFTSTFNYDALNRMTQITRASDEQADYWHRAQFSYNKLGQILGISRFVGDNITPIGVADSDFAYDDLNRLLSIEHYKGGTTWAGYDYEYDVASRITSIDSFLDGLSVYDHDETNQLIGANHTGSTDEVYEYDANGNRIMSGYDIDPNNQLHSDGTYNYTYDAEGNRQTRTNIATGYVTRYAWDHRNRLVQVTEEDNATNVLSMVEHAYDAFNRWIRRSADADGAGGNDPVETIFAYDGNQVSFEFSDDDGTAVDGDDLAHVYTWGPMVDQLLVDFTDGDVPQWALNDHLGTVRDFVEYDAGMTDTVDTSHRGFDSFGNITSQTGPSSLVGFTGRPFDETTGLQNNLHRWYDPMVGTWISEDPIGFGGSDLNLRRYVANRVLLSIDPSGLEDSIPPTHLVPAWPSPYAPIRIPLKLEKDIDLPEHLSPTRYFIGGVTLTITEVAFDPRGGGRYVADLTWYDYAYSELWQSSVSRNQYYFQKGFNKCLVAVNKQIKYVGFIARRKHNVHAEAPNTPQGKDALDRFLIGIKLRVPKITWIASTAAIASPPKPGSPIFNFKTETGPWTLFRQYEKWIGKTRADLKDGDWRAVNCEQWKDLRGEHPAGHSELNEPIGGPEEKWEWVEVD